ncbi:hypothetical protein [Streptomyces thermolineatus]|uniref:hypothetical protein n=1 Tax=Streptomyces thermolineatus TaxID=44033 RepID=UPI0031E162F7
MRAQPAPRTRRRTRHVSQSTRTVSPQLTVGLDFGRRHWGVKLWPLADDDQGVVVLGS